MPVSLTKSYAPTMTADYTFHTVWPDLITRDGQSVRMVELADPTEPATFVVEFNDGHLAEVFAAELTAL